MYNREDIQEFLRTRVSRPASAGVVIYNDKKEALVLKANYKPYWSFPGGWIEDNQTPIQAAVRELSEETGILIIPQRLKFLYIINRVSNIMQSYQFIFEYSGMVDDFTSIKLQPEEIDDYKFVSREEVLINLNNYGGAVQIWAKGENIGYFEQTVEC
ncbi:MAG: NUDIX hydrolase [Candidatus Nanosynbacter sp. HMT-348_TM7c-JB]|nr:MAG: NUDIX hydrolase [Candidatus Nanosynbacter sp. HMT-348_TM7c-JB]